MRVLVRIILYTIGIYSLIDFWLNYLILQDFGKKIVSRIEPLWEYFQVFGVALIIVFVVRSRIFQRWNKSNTIINADIITLSVAFACMVYWHGKTISKISVMLLLFNYIWIVRRTGVALPEELKPTIQVQTDYPVELDMLDRKEIIEHLEKIILESRFKNSFVLGVTARWGEEKQH